jgi:1-acyl-sn-glycerol-3-phosphate acyltransferase
MREGLSRGWRVLATGLSFTVFGVGGLLLRVVVFPVLNVFVRERRKRVAAARGVIRVVFRAFVWMMQALGVLRYEIVGAQRLERNGLLILANHPTLIDAVFLMALVKDADCVVKGRLWNNPFTRGSVRAAGYINNDAGIGLVNDCIASLRSGNNLIIFPEGTRSEHDGLIALKRGAANIAVRGMRDVTPVVIRCDPVTLGKGEKWWRVPPRAAHFRIDVGEDIPIGRFIGDGATDAIAARRLTSYLQHYFTKELNTMLEQEVKEMIIDVLQLEDVRPDDIDTDAPLFGEGLGLDSIDALELGVALQKRYGISLSAEAEDTRRHFASVRALASLIEMSKSNKRS